jgi:GNAT superfamily N-acetyltransferase
VTIAIRRATDADAAAVSALNADVQLLHHQGLPDFFKAPDHETFPVTEVKTLLNQPACFIFLALFDGVPAGYLFGEILARQVSRSFHASRMVYVRHLSVAPQFRKMGVGTGLLDAAAAEGKRLRVRRIALDYWSFNKEAQRFFAARGFAPYNEKVWKEIG